MKNFKFIILLLLFFSGCAATQANVSDLRPDKPLMPVKVSKEEALDIGKRYLIEKNEDRYLSSLKPKRVILKTNYFINGKIVYDHKLIKNSPLIEKRPTWMLLYKNKGFWIESVMINSRLIIDATNGSIIVYDTGL